MYCSLKKVAHVGNGRLKKVRSRIASTGHTDTELDRKSTANFTATTSTDDLTLSCTTSTEDELTLMDNDDVTGNNWTSDDDVVNLNKADVVRACASTASSSWMQSAVVAVAPNLDVLVFGHDHQFVVLQRRPDTSDNFSSPAASQENLQSEIEKDFAIVSEVSLQSASLTCVFLLPLATSRRTETRPYDWMCVLVGADDGTVYFYTEQGTLLLRQQFSRTRVLSIDMKVVLHAAQEVSILYGDCLVTIEGVSLFTELKSCRSQIALHTSTCDLLSENVHLVFRKWNLASGVNIQHVSTGPYKPSRFDQLETASSGQRGALARVTRPSLPHYSTYCTATRKTFLAFHWQEDMQDQPHLTDALYNLADRMTSAVTSNLPWGVRGLWGGGSGGQQKGRTAPVDVRSTEMNLRTTLNDPTPRQADRVYMAPCATLAAVADAHGRISLVGLRERRVLRMWKGYRDAECAWLDAHGALGEGERKRTGKAIFLVIFAPRRGLLEVWTMQNGPRVLAVNVDKGGRLLSECSTVILGAPALHSSAASKWDEEESGVWFLDSDGQIASIRVPLHVALQDQSTAQTHDLHIIKQLKSQLDEIAADAGRTTIANPLVSETVAKLKTISGLRQTLDLTLAYDQLDCKIVECVVDCVHSAVQKKCFSPNAKSSAQQGEKSVEAAVLMKLCIVYRQLINSFAFVRATADKEDDSTQIEEEDVAVLLQIEPTDWQVYFEALNAAIPYADRTACAAQERFSLQQFVRSYDVHTAANQLQLDLFSEEHNCVSVNLKENLDSVEAAALGRFLLECLLSGRCHLSKFVQEIVPLTGLRPESILRLLCAHWLQNERRYSVYPPTLYKLVLHLAEQMTQRSNNAGESWLSQMEAALLTSTSIPEAFTLCLIVRAVTKQLHPASERKQSTEMDEDEPMDESDNATTTEKVIDDKENWEEIHVTVEKWDLYVVLLYALLNLHTIRCYAASVSSDTATSVVLQPFALQTLKESGKGFFREVLARFLTVINIDCSRIQKIFATSTEELSSLSLSPWEKVLHSLKSHLCVSLNWEALLCDLCWEEAGCWNKDPDHVSRLEKAIQLLSSVEHPVLQHGLAIMVWDTFVVTRMKALCNLLEKVGKFPKDRLCRKEVEMGENKIAHFAALCTDLLKVMWKANAEHEYSSPIVSKFEDFVENLFSSLPSFANSAGANQQPLSEVAARQKCTNYHLVLHHWHLALVVQLQVQLALKCKPLSVFDDKGKNALFVDLHEYPLLPMADVDAQTLAVRQKFCTQCLVSCVQQTAVTLTTAAPPDCSTVYELAGQWALDTQALRRFEVVELYKADQDEAAEKLLASIDDRSLIGGELLLLLGGRLAQKIEEQTADVQSKSDMWSQISTRAAAWLRSMARAKSDKIYPDQVMSSEALKRLLDHVLAVLPESDSDTKIANELVDVVRFF